MPSLVRQVQKKLLWRTRRRSRLALVGEHPSVVAGRSLDFDDLREYVPGDDVKDIDWKSTARSGTLLVRRYRAVRQHHIVFVADCGRNMAALSGGGVVKKDLVIDLIGLLGSVAVGQGDNVGLVAGDAADFAFLPLKSSLAHLERLLQFVDRHTSLDAAASDLPAQLAFVGRTLRRRLWLVVLADEIALDRPFEDLLRRLAAHHELVWVTITDADPTAAEFADQALVEVADRTPLPAFLRHDPKLRREFAAAAAARREQSAAVLKRLGIRHERVGDEAGVVPAVVRLLAPRRRHA